MALERLPRRRRKATYDGPPRILAYVRVSTEEQADSRAGLDAQRAAIEREATARDWQDVTWIEDAGYSAKSLDRPGLLQALDTLRAGQADVLVTSKLDRLSRSVGDFSDLLKLAEREGWSLRVLDPDVDMTTATGRACARLIAVFAEMERELIGERTKAALAVKRSQGVKLGRPRTLPQSVRERIVRLRDGGQSYRAIAATLTAEGVPTVHGGAWLPATIRKVALAD